MGKSAQIQIRLRSKAIYDVPLHIYDKDFTFIVNKMEYKTCKLISDLLSPKISHQHINDPTFDTFYINTSHKGNFSHILDLVNFNNQPLPESEYLFISEVLEQLGNESTEITLPTMNKDMTLDEVLDLIHHHQNSDHIYSKFLRNEIDFISTHFYQLTSIEEEKLCQLDIDTIECILQNSKLQLKDENQLIRIVNGLYSRDKTCSKLYENVLFSFVDENSIGEFIRLFDINDITQEIWINVSSRLKHKIIQTSEINDNNYDITSINKKIGFDELETNSEDGYNRYKERGTSFDIEKDENFFDGILNHLFKESDGSIQNVIDITASSINCSSYSPYNVVLYDENDRYFHSNNEQNSWICFDFKEHRIVPSGYVLKSSNYSKNYHHPKSWIVEASNDQLNWEKLDEVNNSSLLNGPYLVEKFKIKKNVMRKEFRYVRIRQTSNNWHSPGTYYYFALGSIEFYGTLI